MTTTADPTSPALDEQARMVEAILFAAVQPMSLRDLAVRMPQGCDPAAAVARLRVKAAPKSNVPSTPLRRISQALKLCPEPAPRTRSMTSASSPALAPIARPSQATIMLDAISRLLTTFMTWAMPGWSPSEKMSLPARAR